MSKSCVLCHTISNPTVTFFSCFHRDTLSNDIFLQFVLRKYLQSNKLVDRDERWIFYKLDIKAVFIQY